MRIYGTGNGGQLTWLEAFIAFPFIIIFVACVCMKLQNNIINLKEVGNMSEREYLSPEEEDKCMIRAQIYRLVGYTNWKKNLRLTKLTEDRVE